MSYRDDHESARAAAERLERRLWQAQREIERLRSRRSRALPFLLAAAFGLIAVSIAAMPRAESPPPPPAPTFAEPPPSPPPVAGRSVAGASGGLGALGALGGLGGPIPRFFQGTVTRAEGDTQVKAGAGCTVSVRALDTVCLVSVTCGGYQPFPGTAFASCSFDSEGFPHGEMHYATPGNSPTDLAMDRGRLTLADTRASHESVVEITLAPANRR